MFPSKITEFHGRYVNEDERRLLLALMGRDMTARELGAKAVSRRPKGWHALRMLVSLQDRGLVCSYYSHGHVVWTMAVPR